MVETIYSFHKLNGTLSSTPATSQGPRGQENIMAMKGHVLPPLFLGGRYLNFLSQMRFPSHDRNESIVLFEKEQWGKGKGTKKLIISVKANVRDRKRKQKRGRLGAPCVTPVLHLQIGFCSEKKNPRPAQARCTRSAGGAPVAGR